MTKPVLTVLLGAHEPPDLERLAGRCTLRAVTRHGLAQALPGSDALLMWDFFSDGLREHWNKADRLRWVHVAAAGVDGALFPELRRSAITLTNAHGVFDQPMAEYVLACALRHAKELGVTQDDQAERTWRTRPTRDIAGASALVIGVGGIGTATGRLLRAVGMNVDGVGRTARPGDSVFASVHSADALSTLVGGHDYVIVAVPLTTESGGLISRQVLAALDDGAHLINVGRGEVIDEDALIDELAAQRISASLDVFSVEPLPRDSPFWALPNAFVSPHTSSRTTGWLRRLDDQFVTLLDDWLAGRPFARVIDKHLGYSAQPHR